MLVKTSNILSNLLYIVFLIFIFIAVTLSIYTLFFPSEYYYHLEMRHDDVSSIFLSLFSKGVSLFLLILSLVVLYFIFIKTKTGEADKTTFNDVFFIFTTALCLRLIFLFFYGNFVAPVSDFQQAHVTAQGWASQEFLDNYRMWTNWAVYSVLLSLWYELTISTFASAQFLNVILTSATAVLIYVLAGHITNKRSIAIISAMLFSLYLPNILNNALLHMDNIAAFLICVMLLLILLMKKQKSWRKYYLLCILAGITGGIENSIKTMSYIVIIAYFICELLDILRNSEKDNNTLIDKAKPYLKLISSFVLMFVILSLTSNAIMRFAERELGIEFVEAKNITVGVIYAGLQPSGEGQIHLGNNPKYYMAMLEKTGGNHDLAREMTYDFLWKDIKENPGQFALLFPQKFRWAWQDDTMPAFYVFITPAGNMVSLFQSQDEISPRLLYISRVIFPVLSQMFYIILMLFTAIGLIKIIKDKNTMYPLHNYGYLLLSLYCFGFFFLLIIMEAQSRYKIMIIPCLCIFAGYGLYISMSYFSNKIRNKKNG